MTTKASYLVVVDDSPAFAVALRFAAAAARAAQVAVTLLCIVEPDGIEAWGGIERALDDEAFAAARARMAVHEKTAQELSGLPPIAVYRKGGRRAVLDAFLAGGGEGGLVTAALVLGAGIKGSTQSHLIAHMTAEKALAKLAIPLIIVPFKGAA